MKYPSNANRQTVEDHVGEAGNPSASNAQLIHHLFPNISLLERFVLSTVLEPEFIERLGDNDAQAPFNLTPIARSIREYAEYLCQKDKWEHRMLVAKPRPMREHNPD